MTNGTPSNGSQRLSPLLMTAIAVGVVGLVLAVVGLIAGGADEDRRAALRSDIDDTQAAVDAANEDYEATVSQGQAYLDGAQEILTEGDQFCGCGQRAQENEQEFSSALLAFLSNPNSFTQRAGAKAASQADKAHSDLEKSLSRLRDLSASLPEPPGG